MSNGFLINTVPGGGVVSSTAEFDVRNYAKRLVLAGTVDGDVVQLQVLAGLNDTTGTWADLVYNGTSIQLSDANTQYEITVEGHYRVTYSGGSTQLQLWMEEDIIGLDQRTISVFSAPSVVKTSGSGTSPSGVGSTANVWRGDNTWNNDVIGPLYANTAAVDDESRQLATTEYVIAEIKSYTYGATVITTIVEGGATSIAGISYVLNPFVFISSGNLTAFGFSSVVDGSWDGQQFSMTFNYAIATLTLVGANISSAGLAKPTAATAGQCFVWVWDSTNKWVRIQ